MSKKIFCLFVFVFFSANLFAQKPPVKFWIKFKDKNGTPYTISNPSAFLGPKAIERRVMYNIKVDVTDLPVTPSYVNDLESVAHVNVVYVSRWMNGAVIAIDSIDWSPSAMAQILSFSFVEGSERVKKYKLDLPEPPVQLPVNQYNKGAGESSALTTTAFDYGRSYWQNKIMDLDCLHEQGFRGQGMTIAVMDAGFAFVDTNPIYDSIRARGGILGGRDFVAGGSNPYNGGTHGSMVFSCMAANKPGVILGSAPMANYWLMRTEAPEEMIVEEYNWIRAAEFADSVGADILTTSLGYTQFDDPSMNHTYASLNGRTAPMSIAATMAARKGMFVLNAAGNERASAWHYISVPADADSVCAVGAIDSVGKAAAFSSVGPTADGRIKPDLVAIGARTWVSITNAECFPGNGTSFATPVLAGAVACYWQAHREFNNMTIMRNLKNSGSNSKTPDNDIGWGVPDLCPTVPMDFTAVFGDESSELWIELLDSDYENITVQVVALSGKVLMDEEMDKNDRRFIIDTGAIADGIYIIKVRSSKGIKAKKIVKG